ncbi:MAG: anthranilate phosphoribosyltransferase [Acidobacteria bacterium]|nr:anthranilate phosphoribosyltransferase [Acidobacteriota bacterium]MDW7983943.1 anthranilate phosphoribosyltransferase [Acidobacteriota bacterium]
MTDRLGRTQQALKAVMQGATLDFATARQLGEDIASGELPPEIIGAVLTALAMRGEAPSEMAGLADAMRAQAQRVDHPLTARAVDTCGTGGDGFHTWNVSTAVAFVVSSLGVPVVKHGNRAVSSQCGSADVLQALGLVWPDTPEKAARLLGDTYFTFLFAPYFHPAMKAVASIRRNLGIRTVFNILGPLTNPAFVRHQMIGVFRRDLLERLAPVFAPLGHERVLLVHHETGMDEAASFGLTYVVWVERRGTDMELQDECLDPRAWGFGSGSVEDLRGGSPEQNARIIEDLLQNRDRGPRRDTLLVNSALALRVAGRVPTLEEGLVQAEEALTSGRAYDQLERLRRWAVSA